jgi:alkanesulfonate monooxygenase SsuD/methylene tetrahydromethanopterin reductase-like flavin-dependent oxidoreductase (luciferase family)
MSHPLRFGILTLPDAPWPELAARWRHVEELGFDSVWDCDHYTNPFAPETPWYEGWTSLAALALQTERIRVGMLVTCATFRNPVLFAKEALTVEHISGGRLELGIGAGYAAAEYAMLGTPLAPPAERVGRFREVVEIVDRLLREGELTYEGRYYRATDALLRPAPLQRPRPPLTLGGGKPQMLRVVARYADRWNSASQPEQFRERLPYLAAECRAIGRDPDAICCSLMCNPYLYPEEWGNPWESPEYFAALVARYRAVGVTEFILCWPLDDAQLPGFERIAREVIPALRAGAVGVDGL